MPYHCPLDKLLNRSGRREPRIPDEVIIPKQINLPQGRQVNVKDIVNKISNYETITRRKSGEFVSRPSKIPGSETRPRVLGPGRTGPGLKYTIEDRRWQYSNSTAAVAERWNLTLEQARAIKYQVRNMAQQYPELFLKNTDI